MNLEGSKKEYAIKKTTWALPFRRACRHWGLQTSYSNNEGKVVWAESESLALGLRALVREYFKESELPNRFFEDPKLCQKIASLRVAEAHADVVSRSLVSWGPSPLKLVLRFSHEVPECSFVVTTEDGKVLSLNPKNVTLRKSPWGHKVLVEFSETLPLGYHKIYVKFNGQERSSLIVCAPDKLEDPKELDETHPSWGPFIPIYALKSSSDFGAGSFKEFKSLAEHLKLHGAKWFGTLPLLAGKFESEDCDPSPYSALSRLFWNEFYLDLEGVLKKYDSPRARSLFFSTDFKEVAERLRSRDYVDYFGVYTLKEKILRVLSEEFFLQKKLPTTYHEFVVLSPDLEAYVRFRSHDFNVQNYHRFVQFEMHEQLKEISSQFPLYMDFPVGVSDSGFDFHQERDIFLAELSVGAPPEAVFQLGQDWGFCPFHPHKHRNEDYVYFRKCLKHHLRFSKILRLDHVMGLYRVYCVPKGMKGTEGFYLRFPPEDLFAISVLEAHRAGSVFVGENLGTVPEAVVAIMKKRNIKGMCLWQLESHRKPSEFRIPSGTLASLNNHDLPPFQSFLEGRDLNLLSTLGILPETQLEEKKRDREKDLSSWKSSTGEFGLSSALEVLKTQRSQFRVLNLEDLWQETRPQNVPGTWKEYPNWRKKFSRSLHEILESRTFTQIFKSLNFVIGLCLLGALVSRPSEAVTGESFDFSGYFRAGTGTNLRGGKQECFPNPGSPTNEFRLGNECGIYGELAFKAIHKKSTRESPGFFNTLYRLSLSPKGYRQWEQDKFVTNKESTLNLTEAFAEGGQFEVPFVLWAGKRYYRQIDAHVNDWFYFANIGGVGAGVDQIPLGPGQLALAHLMQTSDTATSRGQPQLQFIDLRWNDIKINRREKIFVWTGYGFAPDGKEAAGSTSPKNYVATKGWVFGVRYNLTLKGGFNDFAILYGHGNMESLGLSDASPTEESNLNKAYRYRVVNNFAQEISPNFSLLGVVAAELTHNGNTDKSRGEWQSLGLRPTYYQTDRFHWVLELGYSRIKKQSEDDGKVRDLTRLTLAPSYTLGKSTWSRPVLRAYFTKSFWNANNKGRLAAEAPSFAGQGEGEAFGYQMEVWF